MTREAEAIDWSAPIEAYHPDGRVVAVECYEHIDGFPYFTRPASSTGTRPNDLPTGWDDEGRYWNRCEPGDKWRIRNRKPAQQWGDPIEVNGERPVWLGDDDLLQFQTPTNHDNKWSPDDGICGGRKWRHSAWASVQRIRLAADHWVYEALRRGMVPWAGGDGCTSREQVERLALDPDLVDRMAWVIRRLNAGANVTDDDITTAICDIAAELPPEPVDPVVARAREIVAGETDGSVATSFRSGERDSVPAMRAVIRALREGMGE